MSPTLSILLDHLSAIARWRLSPFFAENHKYKEPIPQIRLPKDDSPLGKFFEKNEPTPNEAVLIAIAMAPHIHPHFFDDLIREFMPQGGDFAPIGGTRGTNFRGFLPTGETALFLLAAQDQERRINVQQLFEPDYYFNKQKVLWLEEVGHGEPAMSGRIILSPEYVDLFISGKIQRPKFGLNFPADRVETQLDWPDLVLNNQTQQQVQELIGWLNHGKTLMKDNRLGRRLKPGFRALFWGPPGTGKTLTAGLLGKKSDPERDVYKVDLSMVVSKFIGETEKNLSNLFDRAEHKDWILFFDEADALFGKRTGVRDAHDKYANQEVSYLLQRVEHYNGLIILASNFKSNIDDAFLRRFQSIIHFPLPKASERLVIWEKSMPGSLKHNGVNLEALAHKYELTGASILNIVQYASLRSLERGDLILEETDILEGISREFHKEGKIVS